MSDPLGTLSPDSIFTSDKAREEDAPRRGHLLISHPPINSLGSLTASVSRGLPYNECSSPAIASLRSTSSLCPADTTRDGPVCRCCRSQGECQICRRSQVVAPMPLPGSPCLNTGAKLSPLFSRIHIVPVPGRYSAMRSIAPLLS